MLVVASWVSRCFFKSCSGVVIWPRANDCATFAYFRDALSVSTMERIFVDSSVMFGYSTFNISRRICMCSLRSHHIEWVWCYWMCRTWAPKVIWLDVELSVRNTLTSSMITDDKLLKEFWVSPQRKIGGTDMHGIAWPATWICLTRFSETIPGQAARYRRIRVSLVGCTCLIRRIIILWYLSDQDSEIGSG